jgi:Cu/Zn superoxide dismutase
MKFLTSVLAAALVAQSAVSVDAKRDGLDERRGLKGSGASGFSGGSKSGGKADLIAQIGPYPGSTSSASGTVSISFNKDGDMTIKMDVSGVVATCTDTVTGANQCGIHIHEGTTCNNAAMVGGHFWSPAFSASDPWVNVRYNGEPNGDSDYATTLTGGNGYGADINQGRAFVIHNDSVPGGRIGCGLLEYA